MSIVYHATIPSSPGIYRIRNTVTNRVYVGSAKNLRERCREHFRCLQRNTHSNQKLQRAFNKYDPDTFVFEILEIVLIAELLTAREQYWLDKLQAVKKGFNIAPTAGSNLGLKASPATIEKLRTSHLGQPGYWTGKKRDPETTARASAKKRGKPSPRYPGYTHSASHREKLRLANLGKKQGEEQIRNAAATRVGKERKPDTCKKISATLFGHSVSEETIAKIKAKNHPMKTLIVTSSTGEEFTVTGIHQFCKEHHLDRRCIQRVAQGKAKQHKGYKVRYLEDVS